MDFSSENDAVFLYGSSVSWQQLVGMAMVIAGVYIVTVGHGLKKTKTDDLPPKKYQG